MLHNTRCTVDVRNTAVLVPTAFWVDLSKAYGIESIIRDVGFEDVEGSVKGDTPSLVTAVGGRITFVDSERDVVFAKRLGEGETGDSSSYLRMTLISALKWNNFNQLVEYVLELCIRKP